MTDDAIIDGILDREGEGTPPYRSAHDAGGRTSWGIAEKYHPDLWNPGPPTRAQARTRLFEQYVAPFDELVHCGVDDRIRVALIDDGVLSGVDAAIKRFQYVLGVVVDGVLGRVTARVASHYPPGPLLQRFVVERVMRLVRLVEHRRPADLPNLLGWVTRALSFLPDPT